MGSRLITHEEIKKGILMDIRMTLMTILIMLAAIFIGVMLWDICCV
ncbi:MAG: hypothetical protein Q4D58_06110 [Synergistaceae bacterium]|nr:hypothetical protein [Synergistaceae bacterium]